MQTTSMTPDPALQNELRQDERLLWWGRPDMNRWTKQPANIVSRPLLSLYLIAIVGGAVFLVALFVLWSTTTLATGSDLGTFALGMLGISCYFIALLRLGALRQVKRLAMKTLPGAIYAITDQRVIAIAPVGKTLRVISHTRHDIGRIVREDIGDGWGNVLYGLPYQTRVGNNVVMVVDKMECIPDVCLVEDMLIKTFKNPQLSAQPMVADQHIAPPPPSYPPMPQA